MDDSLQAEHKNGREEKKIYQRMSCHKCNTLVGTYGSISDVDTDVVPSLLPFIHLLIISLGCNSYSP